MNRSGSRDPSRRPNPGQLSVCAAARVSYRSFNSWSSISCRSQSANSHSVFYTFTVSLTELERAEEDQSVRLRAMVLPKPSTPIGSNTGNYHHLHHSLPRQQHGHMADLDVATAAAAATRKNDHQVDVVFIKSQAAMSAPINNRFWKKYTTITTTTTPRCDEEETTMTVGSEITEYSDHCTNQPWRPVRFSFQKHTSSSSSKTAAIATDSRDQDDKNLCTHQQSSVSSSRWSMGSAMSIMNQSNNTSASYYSFEDDHLSPITRTSGRNIHGATGKW